MYLKKINIAGFKSFAKKTSLDFTQGITAIVGPNGSGKSNIADAIRWVMGEQSIKTLRCKRAEDVIFSGSDKKTRLGMAEVSLELDNTDKKIPLDYSEITITRRVYRSSESDYLINNNKSKLSDINLLLTKANFGHRTYSVIGQGMIDNFLIASPAERKEFFEEATGVKQYQIKKQQTLKKLQGVWQNLNTLQIKTTEMEPRLRLLTRQIKKFNTRKKIEKELNQLKDNYYSSCWVEIDNHYLKQKNELNQLIKTQQEINQRHAQLENKLSQLTKSGGSNEKINSLRQKERSLLEEKMELKEKLIRLSLTTKNNSNNNGFKQKISPAELNHLNTQLNLIDTLHQKIIDLVDHKASPELLKKEISHINQKLKLILSYIKPFIKPAALPKKQDQTNPQAASLEKQIYILDQNILSIQNEINQLTQVDSANRNELWQTQQNFQQIQNQLNQINHTINELRVEITRTETKRFDLRQKINSELGGLDKLNKQAAQLLSDEQKTILLNRLNKLRGQLEMIGGLDPEIENEYQTVQERYTFLKKQTTDLILSNQSLKKIINELDAIIKKQLKQSFDQINKYFQKYFKVLFGGGRAELIIIKEKIEKQTPAENAAEDKPASPALPFNFFQEKNQLANFAGIEINATPPGKRLKSINSLSGGERALTSIALICAIISSNPSPFIVLDEVDAALDESNSIRFAEILKDLSQSSQFIVITHNRATMEKANLLYGITIGNDGVSKLISLKLNQAQKYNS